MTSNTIERTYETIATAQKLADKFNQFLDWYKDVEGFHSIKELREMYYKDDCRAFCERSQASQMSHWMRKLRLRFGMSGSKRPSRSRATTTTALNPKRLMCGMSTATSSPLTIPSITRANMFMVNTPRI